MSNGRAIRHVQLTELAELEPDPMYAGVYLCFWHGSLPLGDVELLNRELPLTREQVQSLAAGAVSGGVRAYLPEMRSGTSLLERLPRYARDPCPALASKTSLVICTRNRPASLERCLYSVAKLAEPAGEVLVVDNTPGDSETRRIVRLFEGVRYVIEPCPGLSRARNTGTEHATHELLAFTDDDIVLTPHWLGYLVEPFSNPNIAATSGLVFPAELRTAAQIVFEKDFGGFHQGYAPRVYSEDFLKNSGRRAPPVWSICAGGNMAIRRSTFERFGRFDQRLGAGAAGCSEDSEFWYRILSGGGTCAYVPAAAVHHYHREDFEGLRRQIHAYMRGHVAALFVQFANSREWNNLHRVFLELPLDAIQTLIRWLVTGDPSQRVLLNGAAGATAGAWYWVRHGHRRPSA